MILALNVSNASIQMGGYENENFRFCTSLSVNTARTTDEYAVLIAQLLSLYGYPGIKPEGAILASVVPGLTGKLHDALSHVVTGKVLIVGPGLKTGLNIKVEQPAELGADLVCAAVAASKRYPAPFVTILMDTAISMMAVDRTGAFRGGCIIPGALLSFDALVSEAAQLPQVDLSRHPQSVLGTNTARAMQSGIYYGTSRMLDGMIEEFRRELGEDVTFVATGEELISALKMCKTPIRHHPSLILDGLCDLYSRNIH